MVEWKTVSFIMGSKHRRDALIALRGERPMAPKELSQHLGISMSHTSTTLSELEGRGLVECLTPERHKYKLYRITESGLELVQFLEDSGFIPEEEGSESRKGAPRDVWDPEVKPEESAYDWGERPVHKPPKERGDIHADRPKVVDLFCGCGGISEGFRQAGFDVVLGVDIHRPSIETFRKNHPNAHTILGDIRRIDDEDILEPVSGVGNIDALVAGIPCQGFSICSRKRYDADKRNYLFLEFLRGVNLLDPKYILLENVPTMGHVAKGRFVTDVVKALESCGYTIETDVINALDFGVPQTRERLFFFGAKPDYPIIWPSTLELDSDPERTVRDAIGDLPRLEANEFSREYASDPRSGYQILMRGDCERLGNHEAPRHTQSTIERIRRTKPGEPMYESFNQRIRLDWDTPSPTLVSGGIRPQFLMGHPENARGLTVRERARIQGFPDSYAFAGGIVMGRVQTGNAVPPPVAKTFSECIRLGLRIHEFRDGLMVWWQNNRRHFPWREENISPYRCLISEMLLRKTRAENIVDVYETFLSEYPNIEYLARADVDELEKMLHPLGLSKIRAEALKRLVAVLLVRCGGEIPSDVDKLRDLPHVGRYAAEAIACFAFGKRRAIVDSNVYRVYNRMFGIKTSKQLHEADHLWDFAFRVLPREGFVDYNYALLDFASKVCTARSPSCKECFSRGWCPHQQS